MDTVIVIVICIVLVIAVIRLPVQELLEEDIIETKLGEGEEIEEKSPASSPVPMVMSSLSSLSSLLSPPDLPPAQPGRGADEQVWLQRHPRISGEGGGGEEVYHADVQEAYKKAVQESRASQEVTGQQEEVEGAKGEQKEQVRGDCWHWGLAHPRV